MLSNREVITVKVESSYNNDIVPAVGDAVLCEKVTFSYANARLINRTPKRQSIGALAPLYGGALGQLAIEFEMKGSGAAGTAPEFDALLQSAGLFGTPVASTSVTYKPVSTAQKSVSIYYYQDGRLRKLTGCVATSCSFKLAVGGVAMCSITVIGHMPTSSVTDVTIVSPTYNATVPVPLINVPFSVDSYSHIITSLDIDMGLSSSAVASMSATDGFGQVRVTKRDVKGSFDPEDTLATAYNFDSKFKSGATYSLTTGLIGGTAGNRMNFTLGKITYASVGAGERDGITTATVGFSATDVTTDDDLVLAFT